MQLAAGRGEKSHERATKASRGSGEAGVAGGSGGADYGDAHRGTSSQGRWRDQRTGENLGPKRSTETSTSTRQSQTVLGLARRLLRCVLAADGAKAGLRGGRLQAKPALR